MVVESYPGISELRVGEMKVVLGVTEDLLTGIEVCVVVRDGRTGYLLGRMSAECA